METIQFRCGKCGQLLAVQKQFQGQQVRCPHCQSVVTAPADAPAPVPAPVPAVEKTLQAPANPYAETLQMQPVAPPEEVESIFSAPAVSEDLFGQPSVPKVELPTEVMFPSDSAASNPDATSRLPTLDLGPARSFGDTTQAYQSQDAGGYAPRDGHAAPWMPPETAGDGVEQPVDAATAALVAKSRVRTTWKDMLIIPLISYSTLATVLLLVLYFRFRDAANDYKKEADENSELKQRLAVMRPAGDNHPLKFMPDIDGEFPNLRKGDKKNVHRRMGEYKRPSVTMALPDDHILRVGQPFQLGEIEVTPLRLERGPIELQERGVKETVKPKGMSVKLYLRIKNVSKDLEFCPLDRYFSRYWVDKKERGIRWISPQPPYTYLELGGQRFYGGPHGFYDTELDQRNEYNYINEHVLGQDLDHKLKPGEQHDFYICTDPENERLSGALEANPDREVTWRVHLRRGTVDVDGLRVPCAAVIGVVFKPSDIMNEG